MEVPEAFVDDMVTWIARTVHNLMEEEKKEWKSNEKVKL